MLVSDGDSYLRVPIDGGPASRVTDDLGGGADWGPDDTIVTGSETGGLRIGTAVGGDFRPLIEPADDGPMYLMPKFLPNSRAVVFHTYDQRSGLQVALYDFETGDERVLLDGSSPHYATSGHLVFHRTNYQPGGAGRDEQAHPRSLWAVPFDANRLEVTGEARPVLQGVPGGAVGRAPFNLARDGTLVYRHADSESNRTLWWVDRQGRQEPVGVASGFYAGLRLSPNGRLLAYEDYALEDVMIYNLEREVSRRFTFMVGTDTFPVWTVDGRHLVFGSARDGRQWDLYRRSADGTGTPERLTTTPERETFIQGPTSVTPDGEKVVFHALRPNTGFDVAVVSLDDDAEVQWLLDGPSAEGYAEVSPNGRWLAYVSDESGRAEIYVSSFPDVDADRVQISTGGGGFPLWAANGQELFYRRPSGSMMSVSVETKPTFRPGSPTLLFEAGEFLQVESSIPAGRAFDHDPTGDRFLMVKTDSEAVVVHNWTEELKLLVEPVP